MTTYNLLWVLFSTQGLQGQLGRHLMNVVFGVRSQFVAGVIPCHLAGGLPVREGEGRVEDAAVIQGHLGGTELTLGDQ